MKKNNSSTLFHKNISHFQILSSLNKAEQTKERILKQLEQLDIDTAQYAHLPLKQLAIKVEQIMKNTYSIKYLGLNKNEMGIISRRINPIADQHFKIQETFNEIYSIHKYFYPKPLKIAKKRPSLEKINVQNLQSEIKKQFEENRNHHNEKVKESKLQKMRVTKMAGSWCISLPKNKQNKFSLKESRPSINEIAKTIEPPIDPLKSYSRFLTKGILVMRD